MILTTYCKNYIFMWGLCFWEKKTTPKLKYRPVVNLYTANYSLGDSEKSGTKNWKTLPSASIPR
jgi:hypothetical protein